MQRCGDYMIDEEPIPGPTEAQARLVGFGLALPPEDGPAVFRVHVHDQRAANCAIVYRPTCEQALVVDSVVWTGDAVTATSPLTIEEVLRRLAIDSREMTATPFSVASRGSTGCDPGWPPQSWVAAYRGPALARTAYIRRILVFPDAAAAASVRPRLSSSGGYVGTASNGDSCALVIDGLNSSAWIVVDNVIVEVSYPIGDAPALVGQVEAALKTSLP